MVADNFSFTEGNGKTGAADEIDSVLYPRVKIGQGADGSYADVSSAAPLQVTLANTGANSTAVKVDGSAVTQPISHAALTELAAAIDTEVQVDVVGALPAGNNNIGDVDIASVPAPLSTTGGGTEAAALRVTIATDSTGVVSVDDNGSTLSIDDGGGNISIDDGGNTITVDGTVSVTGVSTLAEQQTQTTHLATIAGDTTDIETAVELIDDTVTTLGTDTYTEAASKGLVVAAVRRDADTTLVNTTNEYTPLQVDANGRLKTEVFSGETLPVSLASVPSHAVTNAGTFAVQESGSALTALQKIDDPVLVDDAAFTPGTSSVMMSGFQADESSTDSVNEGDAGAARMTLDRKVITTPQPHTAGGLSIFRSIDLDESEEEVKASAGQVYGMWVTNTATSTRFVKFYNATAANVTVGTTTPVLTIGIPGNSSDDVSGLFSSTHGIEFGTAISVAATTGVADNDTGAPGANEVIINVFYK